MRTKIRKIGGEHFYYLQHSKRKNGNVKTKELYLGKEIPSEKKLKKLQLSFMKEENNELLIKLNSIKNNFQKEWNKLPESIKEKELKEIAIAFTYNTNAIEGSTITLEETREILEDQIAPNRPLRDIKETEGHAKIFLQMLKIKEKITRELILNWHEGMFGQTKQDIAGKYRDYMVSVAEYRAPDWQDIEKLMKELLHFIKSEEKMNTIEFIARTHYKFEKIHPFGDGNGRIGRLLINYMLWSKKYPMVIIGYKKRKSYYKALKKYENGFVKYFIRYYLTVHKKRISKNI